MARTFDDLATALRNEGRAGVKPQCTAGVHALVLLRDAPHMLGNDRYEQSAPYEGPKPRLLPSAVIAR
ncbi:hypothetical protein ACFW2Y_34650 [Streptomyces sp. NPDC058877]|uniref:hypothetical protein n=1 Tax=unclassified Streptomyces TaxID=2593676 RepID=UPI0036855FFF